MSGMILVIDAEEASEDERAVTRPSGPRFPRPHLQRLETERTTRRLALGSVPPADDEVDFDDAITQVNTPRPKKERPRPQTAS